MNIVYSGKKWSIFRPPCTTLITQYYLHSNDNYIRNVSCVKQVNKSTMRKCKQLTLNQLHIITQDIIHKFIFYRVCTSWVIKICSSYISTAHSAYRRFTVQFY